MLSNKTIPSPDEEVHDAAITVGNEEDDDTTTNNIRIIHMDDDDDDDDVFIFLFYLCNLVFFGSKVYFLDVVSSLYR